MFMFMFGTGKEGAFPKNQTKNARPPLRSYIIYSIIPLYVHHDSMRTVCYEIPEHASFVFNVMLFQVQVYLD